MGDGIEQDGAQLLAFAGGLGAAEFFDGARALDEMATRLADGLQGLPRKQQPETPMQPTTRMPMRSGMKAS